MSSSGEASIDRRLLEAATTGDVPSMKQLLALNGPGVLLGTTPQGNTCLHVASIQGHEDFCKNVLSLDHSPAPALLSAVNKDGETPLLTAVARGRSSLASVLLRCCRDQHLSETILKQDRRGYNVLHHAIRRGHTMLALELVEAEPTLSKAVNQYSVSPLFVAVLRNFVEVFNKLLEIPDSADSGGLGFNILHAAVRNGNLAIVDRIMDTRPWLARQENEDEYTPMHLAAYEDKIDVITVLLEHDPFLGYIISKAGKPLLCTAASEGHVGVAQELLKHCPDAPYCDANGMTCLHEAALSCKKEFVEFVLGSQQLQHLIDMEDNSGETALHLADRNGLMWIADLLGDKEKMNNNTPVADKAASVSTSEVETKASNSSSDGTPMDGRVLEADVSGHVAEMRHLYVHVPGVLDSSSDGTPMDGRVLEAAVSGHVAEMRHLYVHVPGVLLGTTPQGNTCLHIAAIHGHEVFCKEVQALNPSLLATVNSDGETPLLAAVASGRVTVASVLLRCCRDKQMGETILKQDEDGYNVLHHAIRNGHTKLALELIQAEPALALAVNQYGESPMYVAVMRNFEDVFNKLLEIPDSAHGGAHGRNALHAAVRNGNSTIVAKILETRPALARERDKDDNDPIHLAVIWDKINVLSVLLEHDRSLGYVVSSKGVPLLVGAAYKGHVGPARELLKHCPDTPLVQSNGWNTCLHAAVWAGQMEFVDFVLGLPQFSRLINMRNTEGSTALHLAVLKYNPKMVATLLLHPDIDVTVLNNSGDDAIWQLYHGAEHSKTINWNEIYMLMLKADPHAATAIYNLHKHAHDEATNTTRKDIKSLTQTYTGNTSLVAILIATITFAAAFTLPGGYNTDAGTEGLPIMSRKFAFKAFLISDTLAMCSSLVVAFICVIAKWEDLEFLLHYRSFTKKLMWFAYIATTVAFTTGLYTVLAPQLPWLAIAICILTSLLPILTKLLGEWPILRLRFRLGRTFNSELLHMV